MNCFMWLPGGEIPASYDLRLRGWKQVSHVAHSCGPCGLPALLSDRSEPEQFGPLLAARDLSRVVLLGIPQSEERARLLRLGFGDALGHNPSLAEIDARAAQVIELAGHLPRYCELGPLKLDLLVRDGFTQGRRLGLHPREFGLLWRLAAQPGRTVSTDTLLSDVWQLTRRPETNSLAVHVYRLRQKLRVSGLDGWLQTNDQGYRLVPTSMFMAGTEVVIEDADPARLVALSGRARNQIAPPGRLG